MTLQARIDEIAAQEREWIAQGHPVAIVSNTVEWWNERGIMTAEQLDSYFVGDPHATPADRAYYDMMDGYDAWLDEQERDIEPITDEEYQRDLEHAMALDAASANPVFAETRESRLYSHFQPGW